MSSEHSKLKETFNKKKHSIRNDTLICFYTGFVSYMVLNAFFEFLGPVVNELTYWGSKSGGYQRMKVNPKNQFFLVLT